MAATPLSTDNPPHCVSVVKDYLTAVLALTTGGFGLIQTFCDKFQGEGYWLILAASCFLVASSISCLWTFAKIDGFIRGKCDGNSIRKCANAAYIFLVLALLMVLAWSCFYGNKSEDITEAILKSKAGISMITPNADLQFVTASLNDSSYQILWLDAKTQTKWRVEMSKAGKATKIDKLYINSQ